MSFLRRLFYCSVLNFFDIKVCLCNHWRGYRVHWSQAFTLKPSGKWLEVTPKEYSVSTMALGLKETSCATWNHKSFCKLCLASFKEEKTQWMNPWDSLGRVGKVPVFHSSLGWMVVQFKLLTSGKPGPAARLSVALVKCSRKSFHLRCILSTLLEAGLWGRSRVVRINLASLSNTCHQHAEQHPVR